MKLNYMNEFLVKTKKFCNFKTLFPEFDGKFIIAGPCAIEGEEMLRRTARALTGMGVKFLRGGAFKPRTSPYSFQGKREEGVFILSKIAKEFGMYSVSELTDIRQLDLFLDYIDIIQIGARNMQNYELLKELGKVDKPILLKRGLCASINEFVNAAEYIAVGGNDKLILCERGIRTFETETRNTLDISCIPIIHKKTNLPIIVDISHSIGRKDIVREIYLAVQAVGADGIMVEVHPDPEMALSDSYQQLSLKEFKENIMGE